MTTYLVTRHEPTRRWIAAAHIPFDVHIAHLDPDRILPGDVVIGNLPVHVAAEVCARGGRYLHIALDTPRGLRGAPLDAESLARCRPRLEPYRITREPEG